MEEFATLAERLEELWQSEESAARLNKRIVRSLIHEIIIDMDTRPSAIVLVIHWKAAYTPSFVWPGAGAVRTARTRPGRRSMRCAHWLVCPHAFIANVLDRKGRRTPQLRGARSLHAIHRRVALIYGEVTTASYGDAFAADPRIDALQGKIQLREERRYTDRYHQDRRNANGVQVFSRTEPAPTGSRCFI